MKLEKTTWILLVLALILGGVVYFYEIEGKEKREQIEAKQQKIFDFAEDDITKLTIETEQQTLQFERTTNEDLPWKMKQPENFPASDASVSFLLNLLGEGKSDRPFTIKAQDSKNYGFEPPLAKIKVQLKNKENHELILGKPDFEDKFIYAQTDPSNTKEEEIKILLVPKDFQYAVERDLAEWQEVELKPEQTKPENPPIPEPKNQGGNKKQ